MGTYKLVWDDFCSWFLGDEPYNSQLIQCNFWKADRNAWKQSKSIAHPFMHSWTEENLANTSQELKTLIVYLARRWNIMPGLISDFESYHGVIWILRSMGQEYSFKDANRIKQLITKTVTYFDSVVTKLEPDFIRICFWKK
jgi:valyl-tRNA synthetase